MTPGKYDLKLYRGDTHAFRAYLWQDDLLTTAYSLTGCTVAAEIRERSGGTQIVFLNVKVTLPNIIEVTMKPDMYAGCPETGVWDLQVTVTATSEVLTVLAGTVAVTPDVTGSTKLGV